MTEVFRLTFVILFGLGLVAAFAGMLRFASRGQEVEQKTGPVPTPGPIIVGVLATTVLVTGIGEMEVNWLPVRLLGAGLGVYGLVVLPWAVRALGPQGVPGVAVLRVHSLVTGGPYRRIRHPGYSAIIALWLGAAFATVNWVLAAISPVLILVLTVTARHEERLLEGKFSDAYRTYLGRTGRFIPRLTSPRAASEPRPGTSGRQG